MKEESIQASSIESLIETVRHDVTVGENDKDTKFNNELHVPIPEFHDESNSGSDKQRETKVNRIDEYHSISMLLCTTGFVLSAAASVHRLNTTSTKISRPIASSGIIFL